MLKGKYIGIVVAVSLMLLMFSLLASAELMDGLVFLMAFDEGKDDTVKDSSGHGNDGVVGGKVDWIDGKFGQAFHFDGSTHITVENAKPLTELTHPMSVGAWVNPNILGGWRNIMEMDGNAGWKIGFHDSHAIVWTTYHVKDFISQTPVVEGEWTHVTATWDGAEAVVYINGEPDAPIAGGGVIDVSGEPSLDIAWRRTTGVSTFEGGMDEVFIYNRILDENEIKDIMNGFDNILSVEPAGKTASTWGEIKQ